MKRIPLTQGKFSLVDDADYERVSQFKWQALKTRNTWYSKRTVWNRTLKQYSDIYLHRFIVSADCGTRIDHEDGDGLNNQRKNLRNATHSQNIANHPKRAGCSSRFKGVFWHKAGQFWCARLTANYKSVWLGSFQDEKEAALAYDRAAKKYFGKFARPNFI